MKCLATSRAALPWTTEAMSCQGILGVWYLSMKSAPSEEEEEKMGGWRTERLVQREEEIKSGTNTCLLVLGSSLCKISRWLLVSIKLMYQEKCASVSVCVCVCVCVCALPTIKRLLQLDPVLVDKVAVVFSMPEARVALKLSNTCLQAPHWTTPYTHTHTHTRNENMANWPSSSATCSLLLLIWTHLRCPHCSHCLRAAECVFAGVCRGWSEPSCCARSPSASAVPRVRQAASLVRFLWRRHRQRTHPYWTECWCWWCQPGEHEETASYKLHLAPTKAVLTEHLTINPSFMIGNDQLWSILFYRGVHSTL